MKQRRFMAVPAPTAAARFFDPRQYATLCRLCELLSTEAASFPDDLDSLLSQSPVSHQQLYQTGLATLEFQSQATFWKSFAQTTEAEADSLIAPIRQPWIYVPPTTFVQFLRAVKQDIRAAALPREFAIAPAASVRHLFVVQGNL